MLNTLPQPLVQCVHRLKNQDDFLKLADYISENMWNMALMAVKSQGTASDEFSGGFKALESLLDQLSLNEYKAPRQGGKWFE